MKSRFNFLPWLGLTALVFAPVARADEPPTTPPPAPAGEHSHGNHGGMRGDRLKELSEKLQLTDPQKEQVKAIFAATEPQAMALRDDESLSQEDRRAKMQAIRKSTHDQIRALLTADQQKTFDAMPKPGRGHHGPPKGDGQGDAPPPPKQ